MWHRLGFCSSAVWRLRDELLSMNGILTGAASQMEIWPRWRERMSDRLADAVMETREGLDREKVRELIAALWECEG